MLKLASPVVSWWFLAVPLDYTVSQSHLGGDSPPLLVMDKKNPSFILLDSPMNGSLFPRYAMCLDLGSAIVPEAITFEGNGDDSPDLP